MSHRLRPGVLTVLLSLAVGASPLLAGPKAADPGTTPEANSAPPASRLSDGVPVRITTSDHLTLAASWFPPRRKNHKSPGVVLIHDAGADRSTMEPIATRLQKEGFGVVTVDLRGHGESKTDDLDWSKLNEDERKAQWTFAQRDVDAAVRWLLSQDDIHPTRLSLVGHGAGCALAVRHMRDDDNAVAIALIEPRPQAYGFDVEKDLADLEGLPTLVIGSRDGKEGDTERMVEQANSISTGNPYVELWLTRPPVLQDRKTAANIAHFLEEHALPKKGGR